MLTMMLKCSSLKPIVMIISFTDDASFIRQNQMNSLILPNPELVILAPVQYSPIKVALQPILPLGFIAAVHLFQLKVFLHSVRETVVTRSAIVTLATVTKSEIQSLAMSAVPLLIIWAKSLVIIVLNVSTLKMIDS